MPRARANVAPPDEPENSAESPDVQEALDRIAELATAPDVEVYLFRIEPRSRWQRGDAFLESFRGSVPSMEEIQRAYGGGLYRLRPRRSGVFHGKSVVLDIGGEPLVLTKGDAARAGRAIQPTPAGELEERIARLEELLVELRRGGAGAAESAEDQAAARERREERREFRQMMREYLLARAFADPGKNAGSDPIEQLERLLELRDRLDGDSAEEPESPDLVSTITKLVDRTPAPAPAPVARVPAVRRAAPTVATPEERLLDFVKYLARAAEADQDPGELVDWTLTMIPRPLRERIPTVDPASWLRIFVPYADTFQVLGMPSGQAWLERLRKALTDKILEHLPKATA